MNENAFLYPPSEYGPVPFWFWNGEMEEDQIVFQLEQMKEQGVNEVIIHARKGLAIPYLSDAWFERVRLSCETAKRLGMRLWIYDEDNWPSGYASGRVVDANPDFCAWCLSVEKIYPVLGKPVVVEDRPHSKLVEVTAVYQDREFVDITDYGRNGKEPWHSETLSWEVFVFRMEKCDHRPAYSDKPYVDLLNPKATQVFLSVTHKEYKKRLPKYWGNVIKGFFTDEPGFYQNYLDQDRNLNTIAWTPDFAERFEKTYGYDIRPHLCGLWQNMEISPKTRKDYYEALVRFYRESYFDVISSFLHADGLLHIGHLHREEKLEDLVQMEGNFFGVMDALDYSGIDCIDHAFPRVTEKLGASAAYFLNKPRCFSETFGCFSWALTPQEMKERVDLQYVQGVNMLVPHAFFYSTEGYRALESPPSQFIQNPYWKEYHQFANYVSRLSYVLSQGERDAKIAVYYPAKKAAEIFAPLNHYDVRLIDECLASLTGALLDKGIDFDFVSEEQLAESRVEGTRLVIKDHGYEALILPCLPSSEAALQVQRYAESGIVMKMGKDKGFISGMVSFTYYEETDAVRYLAKELDLEVVGHGVYCYGRKDGETLIRFLLNALEVPSTIGFLVPKGLQVERWNGETGETCVLFEAGEERQERIAFGPKESMLLILRPGNQAPEKTLKWNSIVLKCEKASFNGKEEKLTSAYENGIAHFDGTIDLLYTFDVDKCPNKARLCLDQVRDFAWVRCNEKDVGARLWAPYDFDLTNALRSGHNEIHVCIQNVLANRIEGTDLDAGLIGEARLVIADEE